MPVKIKNIGALVEKRKIPEIIDISGWDNSGDIADANSDRDLAFGFNNAIEQQGEVEIGLNREKLIQAILKRHPAMYGVETIADAIIAQESTLLERKICTNH